MVCPSCGSLVGVQDDKCYTCGRANPGLWGFAPLLRRLGNDLGFAPFVIGTCCILYALSLLASGSQAIVGGGLLGLLSPSQLGIALFGASGAIPVFGYGAWWSILSATWLHANLLHIFFNMMAVRALVPPTVGIVGPGRTVVIYVIAGACGFLLSSIAGIYPVVPFLSGSGITVGASASIFGLLGALLHYGRASGSRLIRSEVMGWLMSSVLFGLFMPYIDNTAHLGGFIGGYLTSVMFNPLKRERGDHMLLAVICLAASFLAIVLSFIKFLPEYSPG